MLTPGERGASLEWLGRDGTYRRRAEWAGVPLRLFRSGRRDEGGRERWVRLEASGEVCESTYGFGGVRELGRLRIPGARWLFPGDGGVFVAATPGLWLVFRLGPRPGILESRELRGRLVDVAPARDGWRALVARGGRREVESWSPRLRCRFRVAVPRDVERVGCDPEGCSWSIFEGGQRLVRVSDRGVLATSEPRAGLGGVLRLAWYEDVLLCGLWGALVGYRWPRQGAGAGLELGRPVVAQGGFSRLLEILGPL